MPFLSFFFQELIEIVSTIFRTFAGDMKMFSRENTQALKGFAAIGILLFHILLDFNISPVFNLWGGLFVAVFLILSGYGIEESFRKNRLEGYWTKRLQKVVLPFAFFVLAYNYLFPYLLPDGDISPGASMHKCLDELLYITPTFWFVFFILKCYLVYWIGTRFILGPYRIPFFVGCAIICLNSKAPSAHLEAEQSFCFLAGVLLSVYKHKVEAFSEEKIRKVVLLLLAIGAVFYFLKALPPLHEWKGTLAYNYLLCPFRLSWGLAFIPLLSKLRLERSALMMKAGKYSLEIYVAHIPFVGMITDARSLCVFLACSALGFLLLMLYRTCVEKKLGIAATLYIIINVLFVAKYSERVSEKYAFLITLAALAGYCVLFLCRSKWQGIWGRRLVWGICLLAFAGMLTAQYAIDPYSIQVDRWSALHFPIQNLLSGIYPYSAGTHLGGYASPFPVWQVLHIPFYLLGNVGLSFFAALAFFLWSCWKVQGREKTAIICFLLCSSVAVWYEVVVRSDLITNFLFLTAIINLVLPRLNQQWAEERRWWIACAVGLLACTRLLVLVPIGLLLFPIFIKMRCRRQLAVLLLTLAVFVLTFIPFAVWDWQEFYYFQNNPWSLQTRQGNLLDFIIFVPLAIFLALNHKGNVKSYYRNAALMLVAFVGVTFIHNMYLGENWNLFSSTFDITYFTTSIPFCLLCLPLKDEAKQGTVSKI